MSNKLKRREEKYQVVKDYNVMLKTDERSDNTIRDYTLSLRGFCEYMKGVNGDISLSNITKLDVVKYKDSLLKIPYKGNKLYIPRTINNRISGINKFLHLTNRDMMKINTITITEEPFFNEDKMMVDREVKLLEDEAYRRKKYRLYYMIKVFRCTGIRVSEIKYITVEAINNGITYVHNKGSVHPIIIPDDLKKELTLYYESIGIKSGCIFLTRNGNIVDPSYIRKSLRWLAKKAGVNTSKIYPHNFRHYFALKFLEMNNGDIESLQKVLGHKNVKTTMVYLKKPMSECKRKMNNIYKLAA